MRVYVRDLMAVLFKVGVVCNEGVRQGPIFKKSISPLSNFLFYMEKNKQRDESFFLLNFSFSIQVIYFPHYVK